MTVQEFSNEFDILYNNIMSNVAGNVNEYEKSVFLTRAQEELILEYYGANNDNNGFEETELSKTYLSELVKDAVISVKEEGDNLPNHIDEKSVFFKLPEGMWFSVFESATLADHTDYPSLPKAGSSVVNIKPVTHDNYNKVSGNPFKGGNAGRVLKLNLTNNIVELVSDYYIQSYFIRYVVRPTPIILDDIAGAEIEGLSVATECVLNPGIHREILNRAVATAIKVYNFQNK